MLLVSAAAATVGILAKQSQSAALLSARSRQQTLATLTTANVELGPKAGDLAAVRAFLQSLQADPVFAGGLLLDVDGDSILNVPAEFSLNEEMLRRILSQGRGRDGNERPIAPPR